MNLKERYKKHFSRESLQPVRPAAVLIVYILTVAGVFTVGGPVSNIMWGYPLVLSLFFGFGGAAVFAWLTWPIAAWASGLEED